MANFMKGQHGKPGENLTTINIKLSDKKTCPVVVHKMAGPSIKGFLDDLIKYGCPIKMIGGFSIRKIAGSRRLSQHSYGNAIDINQYARDVVKHGLREWTTKNKALLEELEVKWRMEGGQHWKSPDLGHWEWKGPPVRKKTWMRNARR